MTVSETRTEPTTTAIPRPRSAQDDVLDDAVTAPEPALPEPQYPWPAPWRYSRAARPRSEYWDVATAGWRSSGPYPEQRKG